MSGLVFRPSVDLDRYYTPMAVAERVVEATGASDMESCVDTACGGGSLLRASESRFPRVRCIGVDRDRGAILRLAREKPGWILSRADLLRLKPEDSIAALDHGVGCDFALMNPPFSMGRAKGTLVAWRERRFRASVAMGHVLRTLELFSPRRGGVAVVPESLMFSRLDDDARRALAAYYRLDIVGSLKNSTFRGARANALLVRFSAQSERRAVSEGGGDALRRLAALKSFGAVFRFSRQRYALTAFRLFTRPAYRRSPVLLCGPCEACPESRRSVGE